MEDESQSTKKNIDNEAPSRKSTKCKVILVTWLVIIIYIIIDQITAPCSNFETNTTRVLRLQKSNLPLNNNQTSTINCGHLPYHLKNNQCHFPDACVSTLLNYFVLWVAINPALGAIVLALVYIVACVLFVPGSILTLGAGASFAAALGFSYGILVASISVFVGAGIGATVSFLLGRYILHDFVQNKLIKKFELIMAIDEAILEMPLIIMILLRLSPLVPFNALNYIMSGTSIPTKAYVIGLLGMLPATVAYVFVGASIHGAAISGVAGQGVNTTFFIIGGITAFLAIFLISYFAKKKLNSKMKAVKNGDDGIDDIDGIDGGESDAIETKLIE